MQLGCENVTARSMGCHVGAGMLFVSVSVRLFDYDYDYEHEHEHESGNPSAKEVRRNGNPVREGRTRERGCKLLPVSGVLSRAGASHDGLASPNQQRRDRAAAEQRQQGKGHDEDVSACSAGKRRIQ